MATSSGYCPANFRLKRSAAFALKYRLPTVSIFREFVEDGGFMSYGMVETDVYRRAAAYRHKILQGAMPGDLPIEQSRKFELVINMKTAKVLDLALSPTILARADELIE